MLIADLVAAGAIIFFNNKINEHVKPNMFIIIVGALSICSGLLKFEARKLINTMWRENFTTTPHRDSVVNTMNFRAKWLKQVAINQNTNSKTCVYADDNTLHRCRHIDEKYVLKCAYKLAANRCVD